MQQLYINKLAGNCALIRSKVSHNLIIAFITRFLANQICKQLNLLHKILVNFLEALTWQVNQYYIHLIIVS